MVKSCLILLALLPLLLFSCHAASFPSLAVLIRQPTALTVSLDLLDNIYIGFNQPVQEAQGFFTIKQGNTIIFNESVQSSFLWVTDATVRVDVPSHYTNSNGIKNQTFIAGLSYSLSLSAGAYVSSATSDPSPSYSFDYIVKDKQSLKYNSTLPEPYKSDDVQKYISQLSNAETVSNMNSTMAHLSLDYYNRFFQAETGLEAAMWMKGSLEEIINKSSRHDLTVRVFEHTWKMPSLIATLPATTIDDNNETIIIGAHLDSINRQNWTVNVRTGRAPGANDDGSACALLLEMFRILALDNSWTSTKNIEFHIYSGEEEGLYGSSSVSASYRDKDVKVGAMLQLDQCGYLRDPSNETIAIFTDNTDLQLTAFVTSIMNYYSAVPTVVSNENNRADSDFHSWTSNGYRAAYIAEGPVDDIVYGNDKHTPHDILSGVSLPHVVHVGEVAFAYIIEAAMIKF